MFESLKDFWREHGETNGKNYKDSIYKIPQDGWHTNIIVTRGAWDEVTKSVHHNGKLMLCYEHCAGGYLPPFSSIPVSWKLTKADSDGGAWVYKISYDLEISGPPNVNGGRYYIKQHSLNYWGRDEAYAISPIPEYDTLSYRKGMENAKTLPMQIESIRSQEWQAHALNAVPLSGQIERLSEIEKAAEIVTGLFRDTDQIQNNALSGSRYYFQNLTRCSFNSEKEIYELGPNSLRQLYAEKSYDRLRAKSPAFARPFEHNL